MYSMFFRMTALSSGSAERSVPTGTKPESRSMVSPVGETSSCLRPRSVGSTSNEAYVVLSARSMIRQSFLSVSGDRRKPRPTYIAVS